MTQQKIYRSTFIHCLSSDKLEIMENGALVVSPQGIIEDLLPWEKITSPENYEVIDLQGNIIVPGFVDAHIHLPQFVFAGIGDSELLTWLENYTFPVETLFADPEFARKASQIFYKELLSKGTTLAAIYVTSHTTATEIAFEEAYHCGIRAVIGKVLMERNAPEALLEDGEKGLQGTLDLAQKWHGRDNRLFACVTPRFAITCTEKTMKMAAEVAKNHDLFVQTHVSENLSEIKFVKKLFPQHKSYLDVYDKCGLLHDKTLLGHCVHFSEADLKIMKNTGAKAIHCATSNRFIVSGVFNWNAFKQKNIPMALGSDVAGGFDPFMLHEMREMLETSKSKAILETELGGSKTTIAKISDALYLSTLGGAEALKQDSITGNFLKGKAADFLVLDDTAINQFAFTNLFQSPLERLSRIIYRGESKTIKQTYIQGILRHS